MTEQMEPRRFVVVGAGGVGSWLCEGLARLAQFKAQGSVLLIVDGDNYEDKNKERQAFTQGGNKAVVRANELGPQFPDIYIIPEASWVVEELPDRSEEDAADDEEQQQGYVLASELLNDGDIVYAVVDNFAARKLLFDTAAKMDNIDVFTGGNDDALFGSVYHYVRRDGKDVTDHPVVWHEEYVNPPDRNPGALSCQERAELEGGTQLLATNMAVAAYLLGRTQKVIVEGNTDTEAEIFFDLGVGLGQAFDRTADDVVLTGASNTQEG